MSTSGTFFGILAIFCVFAICLGIASAADTTQSPGQFTREKGQMHPGFDLKNTSVQQEMLSRFEQQGTDVTGLKAAFASGNMADVKTWMENNRPAQSGRPEGSKHSGFDLTNVTRQQEMLSRFEQQGIDVTGLKAAFASGNMADVKTWLDANRPTHPGWQPHPRQQDTPSSS